LFIIFGTWFAYLPACDFAEGLQGELVETFEAKEREERKVP